MDLEFDFPLPADVVTLVRSRDEVAFVSGRFYRDLPRIGRMKSITVEDIFPTTRFHNALPHDPAR